jgi:hypothetical protein
MARILNRPELLEDVTAGQVNRLFLLPAGGLLRRKSLFRLDLRDGCGLLLLHRLAFPSPGHGSIIDFSRRLQPLLFVLSELFGPDNE